MGRGRVNGRNGVEDGPADDSDGVNDHRGDATGLHSIRVACEEQPVAGEGRQIEFRRRCGE